MLYIDKRNNIRENYLCVRCPEDTVFPYVRLIPGVYSVLVSRVAQNLCDMIARPPDGWERSSRCCDAIVSSYYIISYKYQLSAIGTFRILIIHHLTLFSFGYIQQHTGDLLLLTSTTVSCNICAADCAVCAAQQSRLHKIYQ